MCYLVCVSFKEKLWLNLHFFSLVVNFHIFIQLPKKNIDAQHGQHSLEHIQLRLSGSKSSVHHMLLTWVKVDWRNC